MKLFIALAIVVGSAMAAPSLNKTPSPTPDARLDVKLEPVGNSEVKAVITNNGKDDIRIFKPGTMLDESPIQKVKVAAYGRHIPFLGIRKRISSKTVQDDSLERIPAGQSIEVVVDIAKTHDLSSGGEFNVRTVGSLSYAPGNGDNQLIGVTHYRSNTVALHVDGGKAARSHASFNTKMKRAKVQSDCTGKKLSAIEVALQNCAQLASAAGKAATSGSEQKMEEYFKVSNDQTRKTVEAVFIRVEQECMSINSGVANYYCTDVGKDCTGQVLSYTDPIKSYIVYCDLYFDDLPDLTTECHAQDQATTNILHITQLAQIQGTDDIGHGYEGIQGLSAEQELNNADTFALFANAIYSNC